MDQLNKHEDDYDVQSDQNEEDSDLDDNDDEEQVIISY